MEILIGVFGFFLLLSLAALIKYSGNPLFVFSFLLCAASMIWLVRLHMEGSGTPTAEKKRKTRRE